MLSRWSETDFKSVVDAYVARGINRDLAIRTYTTRLLGSDPELVLHGGGNTSVKTVYTDLDGSQVDVLCVKGSGWDMGTIEPQGLPAVRLEPLKALTRFDTLSDDNMVMLQRRMLMDPNAPNPSVEAVLHAVMPFRHVDHLARICGLTACRRIGFQPCLVAMCPSGTSSSLRSSANRLSASAISSKQYLLPQPSQLQPVAIACVYSKSMRAATEPSASTLASR